MHGCLASFQLMKKRNSLETVCIEGNFWNFFLYFFESRKFFGAYTYKERIAWVTRMYLRAREFSFSENCIPSKYIIHLIQFSGIILENIWALFINSILSILSKTTFNFLFWEIKKKNKNLFLVYLLLNLSKKKERKTLYVRVKLIKKYYITLLTLISF